MHVRVEAPSGWFRALRLVERATGAGSQTPRTRADVATRHHVAWAAQPPFDRGDALDRRLARDGLSPSAFRDTLALSPDDLRARHAEPGWLREVLELYREDAPPPRHPLPPPASLAGVPTAAFLEVLRPVLDRRISGEQPAAASELEQAVACSTCHVSELK